MKRRRDRFWEFYILLIMTMCCKNEIELVSDEDVKIIEFENIVTTLHLVWGRKIVWEFDQVDFKKENKNSGKIRILL